MKKGCALLMILLVSPLAMAAKVDPKTVGILPFNDEGEVEYQAVVEVAGADASTLYSNALVAIADLYKSSPDVTQVADEKAGRIIVEGWVELKSPESGFMQFADATSGSVTSWRLHHQITIEVRDGRWRYTVNDLVVDHAWSGNSVSGPSHFTVPLGEYKRGRKFLSRLHTYVDDDIKSTIHELTQLMAETPDEW